MRSIFQYHQYLSPIPADKRILLGEGQTPLIKSKSIGEAIGVPELYFKLESLNPTGSYKDRFAAMFVSLLQSRSIPVCIATSSGNTGAALAAYCAAASIKCILAIVDGAPLAKLKQMQLYGASTYIISGFGKDMKVTRDVFEFLDTAARSMEIPLPISAYQYCPEGMQGVQTISYELLDEAQDGVDHVFSPAGGGGLTLAIAKGIKSFIKHDNSYTIPKLHCVQPEGNDTIASALRKKSTKATAIVSSTTQVSGLQVPNVLDGDEVIRECSSLGGNGYSVKDEEVFSFQRKLALHEGIFCEPAGAVALAGLALAVDKREISSHQKVVCIVTGHGFKDMNNVDERYRLDQSKTLERIYDLEQVLTQYI